MGSLRCHYDEENENVKKVIGSGKQNNNLHVHHAFLYYSWPSLHDYDMNWKMYDSEFLFLSLNLNIFLKN